MPGGGNLDHFDADRSEVKAGGEGGFWGRRQSAPRPLGLCWRTEAAETRRAEQRAESSITPTVKLKVKEKRLAGREQSHKGRDRIVSSCFESGGVFQCIEA